MSWNHLSEHEQGQLNTRLTDRQFACYVLWLAGTNPRGQRTFGYSQIAAYLGISRSTAITHVRRARAIHEEVQAELLEAA